MGETLNVQCIGRARAEGADSGTVESVVVMAHRDGTHRVVLVAGDNVCGTAVGHWPAGFFDGDFPRDHDVRYVADRFGLRAEDISRSRLRVWNSLYKDALSGLSLQYEMTEARECRQRQT